MTEPHDFLEEADSLQLGARANETRRRTVVSRAYYGCYHLALALARSNGYMFDKDAGSGRHQHLINYLREATREDDLRQAVGDLVELRTLRARADYFLRRSITFEDAQDALDLAREISAVFNESLQE